MKFFLATLYSLLLSSCIWSVYGSVIDGDSFHDFLYRFILGTGGILLPYAGLSITFYAIDTFYEIKNKLLLFPARFCIACILSYILILLIDIRDYKLDVPSEERNVVGFLLIPVRYGALTILTWWSLIYVLFYHLMVDKSKM